ncbi:ATP-dependent DNA helicase [Hydrogenophaga aromaticivorans]|uniref:ATP-dependent DNA helicase n=1 Tax=Hydrogenophaga aromaticivorans TaxID=2610898 RepID=UPI0031EF4C8D
MTLFVDAVAAVFADAGPLAASTPGGLQPRQAQIQMARAVAEALETQSWLAVEAGTGVGKTFAYLAPLLLSGRRALLSTATQSLQEQLYARDIPALSRALGLPVRVALLKGRSSYVCLQRLEQARSGPVAGSLRDPALAAGLEHVHRWATASVQGDLAELPGLDERSPLRPWISSTRENCLGGACPRLASCHVNRARRVAQQADWVVINHHLYFSDQAVQASGEPLLLPQVEVVVFDEAHRLNEIGVQFMGVTLDSGRLRELAREVAGQGQVWARGQRPWAHLALELEQAVRGLAGVPRTGAVAVGRCRWSGPTPDGLDPRLWTQALMGLAQALRAMEHALEATQGAAVELQRLLESVRALQAEWPRWRSPRAAGLEGEGVRWADVDGVGGWRLVSVPPDASTRFSQVGPAPQAARSWIFTSATLGGDDALRWFTEPLGLHHHPGLRTLRLPSPFDHAALASLYVPHDLPEPGEPDHTERLAQAVSRWASRLGGRTLVLTTTLRAADRMTEQLASMLPTGPGAALQVLGQGRLSRRALLARFRAAAGEGHAGAILVASASFWEGVDLAGDVLQLLVIDKLPFPSPDDPLIEARAQKLTEAGLSAFNGVYMPQAVQALRQGVGRLIRSETDRGVLVIGDRRLLTRSYGNALLADLPPMRRLVDEGEVMRALDELALTRASTRGR